MYEFKYEIRLNDEDRPYIHLPNDYKSSIEDNFMAIEIARYIVYGLLEKQSIERTLPEGFLKELGLTGDVLAGLGNNLAKMIKNQSDLLDGLTNEYKYEYFVEVADLTERDNFPFDTFIYQDGLAHYRREGLKVKLTCHDSKYELKGGITNEHWTEIK